MRRSRRRLLLLLLRGKDAGAALSYDAVQNRLLRLRRYSIIIIIIIIIVNIK